MNKHELKKIISSNSSGDPRFREDMTEEELENLAGEYHDAEDVYPDAREEDEVLGTDLYSDRKDIPND